MAVNGVNSTDGSSTLGALASGGASGSESEQRFLKLLVTQLNNQDPLSPLDNAQLTSQLAQMSTVSGIEKLNSAFQSLLAQSGSSQVLQSASLIGRNVLVPGNELTLKAGTDVAFAVEALQGADSMKVTVTNAAGDVVRTFDLGALPQGVKTLSWDGLSDSGAAVSDGAYKVSVEARVGDTKVAAGALTYAEVTSVSQGSAGISLDLSSGKKAGLGDVRLIL
ncbi:flagellar hook assembly protein FlgD [Polaromonas sp.]|uniref:flagellar hook assembly protein FlgD n=1 Tax=Polaromonas sp. TaxID=1869339 RepID=UPI003BABFDF8